MAAEVSSENLTNATDTLRTHNDVEHSVLSSSELVISSNSLEEKENAHSNSKCENKIVFDNEPEQLTQGTVNILGLNSNARVQIISDTNAANMTGNNGPIYLLVSNDSPSAVIQTVGSTNEDAINVISTDTLKNETDSAATVQIMNSEGIPVNINVNDLLSTITGSKASITSGNEHEAQTGSILSLSSSILSTTGADTANNSQICHRQPVPSSRSGKYVIAKSPQVSAIPNWALHLRDCTMFGDTYTGYVTNEVEMDAVLNLYKKETQSLFAIRQTPSPAKDETTDTVRLMWKSQYVPYDGIPFVNVGRRATVMECEHGPRKRSNALKRMLQHHGQKHALKKIPNLTCPARLFVKKVRKFPQYRVPTDADPKLLRQLQEQSLKLVRQAGFHTGEIRLYMQLPLPTAHRYHNVGHCMEAFRKEIEEPDDLLMESIDVDSRVLNKIQELVRQGFVNPFIVRAAVKDFVENKMELNAPEQRPYKHNKAFYPPLIEIQNMIQQTQAALNSGVVAPLPAPEIPPVPIRQKRKRTTSMEMTSSPLIIKKIKVDQITEDVLSSSTGKTGLKSEEISESIDQSETISLSLTDNQLQNFSITNFTYDQLAQLAKIGLLALTNAAKDTPAVSVGTSESVDSNENLEHPTTDTHVTLTDDDRSSTLLITANNAEDEKLKLDILTSVPDVLQESDSTAAGNS